jgi:threonine synthase
MVSWICLDGQEALDAVWESNGYATYVKDSEMLVMSNNLLKEEGLSVLPASAASLVAIQNYIMEKRLERGLNLVALLTARIPY